MLFSESTVLRYADFAVHPKFEYFVVAVQEDHTKPDPPDIITNLCVINTMSQSVRTLVSGADFYSSPGFTPDGSHVVWQQWKHPDMPWDGSEIYVARVTIDQGKLVLSDKRHVAGKWKEVSAQYPVWASDDVLLFTSDESGYQNTWTYSISKQTAAPLLERPVSEDFSLPMWQLGWSFGAPLDKEGKTALYTAMRGGRSVLYVLDSNSRTLEEIECPYVEIQHVRAVTDDAVVFLGAKANEPANIILCTVKDYSKPEFRALKPPPPNASRFSSAYFSQPKSITLPVPPDAAPLHTIYYPPTNPDFVAPEGERPPCVVSVHGGPTHASTQAFNLLVQFFTSRGWAW